jgi:hypothetical protein
VIHLSLDPLQIYWVGKGGKRKWINLEDVIFLRSGVFKNDSDVSSLQNITNFNNSFMETVFISS